MKVGKRIGAFLALLGLALMLAPLTALADHDGGVDEVYVSPDMNQESYWEARFGGAGRTVECTKFEGHYGNIPEGYEAVVVHDGQEVRVYGPALDGLGAFTASGPFDDDKGKHKGAPHSWIMKCDIDVEEVPDVDYICDPNNPGAIAQVPDGEGDFETPEDVGDACTPAEPTTTTTTAPVLLETTFQAFVSCNVDGSFEISVEFGDGMASALVSLYDPMFPVDPDVPDGVLIEVGSDTVVRGTVPADRSLVFQIDGVAQDGYVIIPDDSRLLTVEPCPEVSPTTVVEEEPTTTAAPVTTTTVAPDEDLEVLPFTGVEDFLLPLGGLLVALGGLVMLVARRASA